MLKSALETTKKHLIGVRKKISNIYKKSPRLFVIVSSSLLVVLIAITYFFVTRVRPNDDIFFLSSSNNAVFANKNPLFSVNFGRREDPNTQWVRFEAKATSQNPFEKDDSNFFTKVVKAIKPKSNYGIEMSLKGVNLSETENLDLGSKEETVKNVAEIIGTDEVKTSTELVDSGRVIGENSEEPVSKKTVLNKNVARGVDIEYQILSGLGLKEEIVINNLEEYAGDCINNFNECAVPLNEFTFDLKLDKGLELRKGWFTLKGVSTETYYFVDKDGNYVAHFLPSWAVDSLGEKTYEVSLNVNDKGNGNYEVKVTADASWLFSSDRMYPIRIDPSIIHDSKTEFDNGTFLRTASYEGARVELASSKTLESDSTTVGYWSLDETGGSGAYIKDSSPNGNNATPSGGSYNASGKVGGARTFSSSSDNIQTSSVNLGFTNGITAEAWVYPTATDSSWNWIVSQWVNPNASTGSVFNLSYSTDYKPHFHVQGSGGTLHYYNSPTAMIVNSWNYVAATYNGSTGVITIYINGTSVGSSTGTAGTINNVSLPVMIGKCPFDTIESVKGSIDEVKISNVVKSATQISNYYLNTVSRSEDEIASAYYRSGEYISDALDLNSTSSELDFSWVDSATNTTNGETPFSSTGLVGQWNFNESSGTTATNTGSCGASCNGTLNGFGSTGSRDAAVKSGWTADNRRWGDGALMFDGSNDYVSIPNSIDNPIKTGSFTVSGWFNSSVLTSSSSIVILQRGVVLTGGIYYGIGLYVSPYYGTIEFRRSVGTTASNALTLNRGFELNKWYYVSATYDDSTGEATIYINGDKVGSQTFSTSDVVYHASYDQGYTSGAMLRNVSNQYSSTILDTISVYSRVLGEDEIISNYQAGNIEFQYRSSSNGTSWSDWSGGTEEAIESFDNSYLYSTTSAGLVSYWNMHENSGSTVEDVKGSNEGTATGTKILDGVYDKSRNFLGSGNYITVPNSSSLQVTNAFTIEGWINPSAPDNDGIIYKGPFNSSQGDYQVTMLGNTVYCRINNDTAVLQSSYNINSNEWTYFACTYDKDASFMQFKLYLNGVVDSQTSYNSPVNTSSSNLYIGAYYDSTYAFSGGIDEVRLYNTALSGTTISTNYANGKDKIDNFKTSTDSIIKVGSSGNSSKITTGQGAIDRYTVGYWSLDETGGSGAYIKDSSPNGNNATPSGGSYNASGKVGGARTFSSSSDNIQTSSVNLGFTNGITAEAWVYPTATDSSWNWIVSQWVNPNASTGSVFNLSYSTDYKPHFNVQGSAGGLHSYTATTAMTVNSWNYVAATYNGSTGVITIYINGTSVGSSTGTAGTINNVSLPVMIGKCPFDTIESVKGSVDEVRLSNKIRSEAEILQAYSLGRYSNLTRYFDSKDLSSKSSISFNLAADRPGTYLSANTSESFFKNYEPDSDTVAYWHLNEATASGSTVYDSSNRKNNGTFYGTSFSSGKIGGARVFNGSSDYIPIDECYIEGCNSGLDPAYVSVAAWIKTDSTVSSTETIYDRLNSTQGFALYVNSSGLAAFGINGGTATAVSTTRVDDMAWHYVVGTYDFLAGGTQEIKIYVDGILSGAADYSSTISYTGARNQIGRMGTGSYFGGVLDEISVSAIIRTADEIRQAYEIGLRSKQIVVEFGAGLQSSNLIANSSDTSFTIDSTKYGASNYGDNIYKWDKIIIKENYDGVEYRAQGTVSSVTQATGAVTVFNWDSGSTFPSGGFSVNADVFKWQKEYISLKNAILPTHLDSVTMLTFTFLNGSQGRNIWIDDIKSASFGNETDFTNSININGRYFQYKAIITTNEINVTPYISSVQMSYDASSAPTMDKIMRHGKWFNNGQKQNFWWSSNQ
jgi:hypothetical protein